MKAYSLWQPWASLIVYGPKRIENRKAPPPSDMIGRRFAIHVTIRPDHKAMAMYERDLAGLPCPFGAIIGTAVLDSVISPTQEDVDPWYWKNSYGWRLRDVVAFREPKFHRGYKGWFECPTWALSPTAPSIYG